MTVFMQCPNCNACFNVLEKTSDESLRVLLSLKEPIFIEPKWLQQRPMQRSSLDKSIKLVCKICNSCCIALLKQNVVSLYKKNLQ